MFFILRILALRILLFLLLFMIITEPAYAYIGPAIAFLGYLLGPLVAVIGAIVIILAWPAMSLYKKYKKNKAENTNDNVDDSSQ